MTDSNDVHPAAPAFPCKIIRGREELPESRKEWTRASRDMLRIETDHLVYDSEHIHFAEIDRATLHIYKSAFFFEYAILSITARGKTDHFGIKYCDFWKGEPPFALERVHHETPFITFRRTLIAVILLYLFWKVIQP